VQRLNGLVDSLNWMQGFKDEHGYGYGVVDYSLESVFVPPRTDGAT